LVVNGVDGDVEVDDGDGQEKSLETEAQNQSPVYIDGTLGTAGHTIAILKSDPTCRVISFDRDAESMQWAKRRLEDENLIERVALVNSDFRFAPIALEKLQDVVAGKVDVDEVVEVRAEDVKDERRGEGSTPVTAPTNLDNSEDDSSKESDESEGLPSPRVLHVGQEFLKRKGEVLLGNIAGALVDAGMSMFQIAWGERGLSFQQDAELDMRYDRQRGLSAFDLVNRLSSQELEDLFFKFTDERWARRIAAIITEHRRRQVIHTTSELTSLIEAAIPVGVRRHMRVHPATRVFAALRLAVNDEFWALEYGAWSLSSVLANEARFVVLTYSSHEDRTIKRTFRRLAARSQSWGNTSDAEYLRQEVTALSTPPRISSMRSPLTPSSRYWATASGADSDLEFSLALPAEQDEIEPPEFLAPYLQDFGKTWQLKIVSNKPIEPSEEEVAANPLSRSCKLRAIERVNKSLNKPLHKKKS
jgi:16S rRNA C1402 N4-methylase RsmH